MFRHGERRREHGVRQRHILAVPIGECHRGPHGIQRSHRAIAAGHCTVDALKTRATFDSYDAWFAVWVKDEDPGGLLVAMGVLEDCETQVGI